MTFSEVLNSNFKYLVEAIEHGSSDQNVIARYKSELLIKTGYAWID